MIEKIKLNINNNIGNNVRFIINNLRNKSEEHEGVITEAYSYVFIIKTRDNTVKSFSYSDILTQNVQLFFK